MLVVGTFLAALAVTAAAVVRIMVLRDPVAVARGKNFKGVDLPIAGGLIILLTYLCVEAVFAVMAGAARSLAPGPISTVLSTAFGSAEHLGSAILVLGFCLLGMIDDFAGKNGEGSGEDSKGFRGHGRQLRKGVVTTGAIKAVGGLSLGLIVGVMFEASLLASVLDAVLIVLAANALNLLDLRPGRCVKGFFLLWVPISLLTWTTPYLPASVAVVAAAAVFLSSDLKEEAMLGDSGANLLGALAGAGLAIITTLPAKFAAVCLLTLITIASEKWSFSTVIEKARPLRWFDRLGRVREEI
ncbi:MAG: hypothetical protein ABIS18_01360 [Actinomycetota bacterium]